MVREVAGPFGIPDFIAVAGSGDLVKARLGLGVPPLLNEVDSGIAGVASSRYARDAAELALRLGWSKETVQRRTPHLLRTGALIERRTGRYVRPADLVPIGRLFAIETKVSNWRQAVRQGRTYRLWCENYVVVMPRVSTSSITELVALVAEDGSGLVIAGRWARRPRARRVQVSRALWGSEHVVAALAADPATNPPSLQNGADPREAQQSRHRRAS
jgi:hypothetical protein